MALPRHDLRLSRSGLLRLGAAGGAALVVPTGIARAASTPSDGDLAYLRLLVGAELLAADFSRRALHRRQGDLFRRARADAQTHYAVLAQLLQDAGQPPAKPGDFGFTYPHRSFSSQASVLRLGRRVARLVLGAYLGAIGAVEDSYFRLRLGQMAANTAQHLAALDRASGRPTVGPALPSALSMNAVSNALDGFES